MKRLTLLLFLFIQSLSSAECFRFGLEDLDFDAIVGGAVNSITGEYLESATDLLVAAPDPLVVRRHYSSGDCQGWMFSPSVMLVVGEKDLSFCAFAALPSGTILPFNGSTEDSLSLPKNLNGFSHCPDENENLKQATLSWKNGFYVLTTPQGGRRFYKAGQKTAWEKPLFEKLAKQLEQPSTYFLVREQLPSGNQLIYHYYYKQHQLKEIEETNAEENQVLGWIRFSYPNPQEMVVNASDGQEVHYLWENDLLKKVISNRKTAINYSYSPEHLLCHKEGVEIEYEEGRVKTLKTAGVPYTFLYRDLATEIIDPRQNKSIVSFNSDRRITSIEHFEGDVPFKTIKKKWNEKGNLAKERVLDGSGHTIWTKNYQFDDQDHFIQEKLTGRLTGQNQDEEYLSPIKTFSNDAFHLILKTKDEHDTELTYSYRPGTNLLTQKLFLSAGEVKKRWAFEYDENSVLVRMVEEADGESHVTTIVPKTNLPAFGQPQQIQKATGRIVYEFNEKGEVIFETIFSENDQDCFPLEKKYDSHGNLIFAHDLAGNVTESIYDEKDRLAQKRSPEGFFEYFYDAQDHLTRIKQGDVEETFSYNDVGDLISSTNKRGHTICFSYDCLGRRTQDDRFHYSYDIFNRPVASTDGNGYTTTVRYNSRGKPLSIHYPDGSEEAFSYDLAGTLHRKLERDGTLSIYEYDSMGRTERIEHFSKADKGPGWFLGQTVYRYNANHLISSVNEQGYELSYQYDPAGRLRSITGIGKNWQPGEEPPQIEYSYDSWGRVSQERRGSILLNKKYDRLGRLIEEQLADDADHSLPCTTYSYNAEGDLIETKKGSFWQTIDYDALHRPIQSMDAENNQMKVSYDGPFVKTIEDQRGWKTIQTLDDQGHLLSSRRLDSSGNELSCTQFAYDVCGQKISESIEQSGQPTQKTEWTYGPMGRIESLREAIGTADERKTVFSYSKKGKLKRKILPSGKILQYKYSYDVWEDDSPYYYSAVEISSENDWQKFFFDSLGQVVRAESNEATVTRIYGYLGKVLEEKITGPSIFSPEVLSSFDALGRCTSIQLPDSSKIIYSYQGLFPQSVSRLSSDGKTLYSHKYVSFDSTGHLCKEELIQGCGARQYEWNACGKIQSVETPFFHESIVYDSSNRPIISQKKDALGAFSTSYSYDELSQLISENNQPQPFDSMGNPANGKTNALNELLSFQGISCKYDSCGHLQEKQTKDRKLLFETTPFGALSKVKGPDWDLELISDAFGRRLALYRTKSNDVFFRNYFFFDDQELGALNFEGEIAELKVPSLQNGESVAFELKTQVFLPNYDLQGNVVSLVDPSCDKIVESYRYSAFGEETIFDANGAKQTTSPMKNPWRYAGQRVDSKTGFVHFTYRDYDPQLRRWIQPDPADRVDGPNLYQYCRNNPLCNQDPIGLSTNHYYTQHKSFEEYFFYGRRDEDKSGGTLFLDTMDFFGSARFQGSVIAFGGLVETSIGGAATLKSLGLAVSFGWPIMIHGLDQFLTGMDMVISGNYSDTVTSQLLQAAGLSEQTSNFIDSSLSMGGSFGGAAVVRLSQLATFPNFRLPAQGSQTTLYRAVQPIELADIQKAGILRNLGDAEGKYFTTSIEGASLYAKKAVKAFGDPPYTLIKTQIPNNILNGIPTTTVDGGIPAWVISDQRLEGLIPEIVPWMAVPK